MKAIIFDYTRTIYDPENSSVFPGAIELIQEYKNAGFKIFMVAKGGNERRKQVADLNISYHFEKIVIKPEKTEEDFINIMRECEKDTEFYVVGDRARREIRFGNQCGMTTIWFRKGKFASEDPKEAIERPDYIIDELEEIKEIIKVD